MQKRKLMLILATVATTVAMATDYTVTSSADDGGTGTLRHLIVKVAVDGDRILFDPGVTTITLNGTQIAISNAISVVGSGVTINGNGASRAFYVFAGTADAINLTGLRFTNCTSTGNGGAIYIDQCGPIALADCVFSGCSAASGGAIYNEEELTLSACRMTGNSATADGGAVRSDTPKKLTVTGGWYANNYAGRNDDAYLGGGAIMASYWQGSLVDISGGTVFSNNTANSSGGAVMWGNAAGTIRDAVFVDNANDYQGGALGGSGGSNATVRACTFLRNRTSSAGGGVSLTGGTWQFLDNQFRGNTATNTANWRSGGGVCLRNVTAAFTNCSFEANGNPSGAMYGGAIFAYFSGASEQSVTYCGDCRFEGNYADGASGYGGAVSLRDRAYLSDCTFVTNRAGVNGGAIHVAGGSFSLTDSTLLRNTAVTGGGAVVGGAGAFTAVGCTFTENRTTASTSSTAYGGAIGLRGAFPTVVSNCVFTCNSDSSIGGGAIGTYTDLARVDCYSSLFEGNSAPDGGAIRTQIPMDIRGCTFVTNNCSDDGGAIMVAGATQVVAVANCTFAGNVAVDAGAAICGETRYRGPGVPNWQPKVVVYNATIVTNRGDGAIRINRTVTEPRYCSVYSSIVAGNVHGAVADDLEGDFIDVQYCRIGETANSGYTTSGSTTGTTHGQNTLLGPLADNGGPELPGGRKLLTHALLTGSPALNAGSNVLTLPYDQRGVGFVREYPTGQPDIGAYEYAPTVLPFTGTLLLVR